MPAKTDHKKEVEAILEQKLSEDALQLIHFNQRVAISTRQESIKPSGTFFFQHPMPVSETMPSMSAALV